MRKLLLAFLVGGILGASVGVALGFFFFPFVFPPPVAMDALSENERTKVIATGEFLHANPADPIHYGRGRVTATSRTVFLEDDFEVGPGPAFHVYLVPRKEVRRSADVTGTMFVDLGPLRAFKGSQRYSIPSGVDVAQFDSVVIWCREFSVLISPADLQFKTSKLSAVGEADPSIAR
ncbi:hypothetical protein AA309_09165 [Microvirga vignae]|uniref:DM13 domain-containing protein n=1 Tax=Microvirga vignae TaxID=1225564 RepID=A0A0H1RE44_9HYPH|nr:DM13 domain-containing protein [Microvirga vignae]KLK93470.1 hypothetical protein AA309_09165 [Microvirga vignae]